MQIDSDTLHYLWSLLAVPAVWLFKVIWQQQKSLQQLREEIARDYYTKTEVDHEINDNKDDLKYIRGKLDKVVDRMLDK